MSDDKDLDFEFPETVPDQWQCQSCGHRFTAPWPPKGKIVLSPKLCPKCKSYDAMPEGR